MRGSHSFRPHERLRTSGDYLRVKKAGKRVKTRHFVVNFVANDLSHHRLGMVVQKRYYDSVRRNRIKRCLREWFRIHKGEIPPPGKDIVIIARAGAQHLSSDDVVLQLRQIFSYVDGRNL